jgi:hypothetical protein
MAIWQEAADAIDPTFNAALDGPQVVTLAPQTPHADVNNDNADAADSATPPESAAERMFREETAGNAKSAVRFVHQVEARERLAKFAPMAEKAIIDLYSHPPDDRQNLSVYLRVDINDAKARQTILDAVAKNLANPASPTTRP